MTRASARPEDFAQPRILQPESVGGFDLNRSFGTLDFFTSYDVGVTRTTEPGGTTCAEYYGTLSKRRECAGKPRGSTNFDALGNVVSITAFDGLTTKFEYDDFYRVKSETTLTSLDTCEGIVTNPTVTHSYNDLDQLVATSLSNGVTYRWSRDDLGRLTSARAVARSGPQELLLNRWEYVDGAPMERRLFLPGAL